ncbi:MAG: hypothetical protein LBI68_01235 [Azoarcus sp.]|jgi:hypothetical protein|nr:hypothetical protein [Azoarcus sp.]
MSYFELSKPVVGLFPYPFDFHSHFTGILPLESDIKWSGDRVEFDTKDKKKFVIDKTEDEDLELSIIGMIVRAIKGKKGKNECRIEAHYKLFDMVLQNIIKQNPFNTTKIGGYQRGECAAENIYIACCLLLQNIGIHTNYEIDKSDIYDVVRSLLSTKNSPVKNEKNQHIVAYFNRKIFTANKYTPFDDAYWARDAIRDEDKFAFKKFFNWTTLCYLYESGIRYSQIAASVRAVKELDPYFTEFNGKLKAAYKLLAHSPHVYSDKDEFLKQLNEIMELFKIDSQKPKYNNLVGIDLLAPENKTGLYGDFFKFLNIKENKKVFSDYVGTQALKPCKKIIIHIHCGEGGSQSEDNRSLSGYFLSHAFPAVPRNKFFKFLAGYARKCYQNTLSRKDERERERKNLAHNIKDYSEISSLLDELFYLNTLSFEGLQLRRFDISSQASHDLVVYNGQINITHLCEELEKVPEGEDKDGDKNYYELLCDPGVSKPTPYSFRIGHAYYARNYVVSKFPALYYDTNLGSNFITGASGLFDSAQIYRLNKGFRHLNGSIDTDILEQTMDRVAYMGIERLNEEQIALVSKNENQISNEDYKKLGIVEETTIEYVRVFLNTLCWGENPPDENLKRHRTLLLALIANWRSYMFGADGQGVEHSDIEVEAARMALMLAYRLSGEFKGEIPADLIQNLSKLFYLISKKYWEETIGECSAPESLSKYTVENFHGFKSPHSIVLVKAERKKIVL